MLEDKEWLLKEVHHRVKNNLQIVISLLNTQSRFLNSQEAINAIQESRHRMQAMSLIHQKLYQGESSACVNMNSYIQELSEYLDASLNANKKIRFTIQFRDVELDIVQAIPVGLILNELITNAIKYAFPGKDAGSIQIIMHPQSEEQILLQINDDGIGLHSDFDMNKTDSMGMRLIRGLVRQINGSIHFFTERGVHVHIKFKADNKLKSMAAKESLEPVQS